MVRFNLPTHSVSHLDISSPSISHTLHKDFARLFPPTRVTPNPSLLSTTPTPTQSPPTCVPPNPSIPPTIPTPTQAPPTITSSQSSIPSYWPLVLTHSMTTHSKIGIVKPNPKYALSVVSPSTPIEPKYVKVAIRDPSWHVAMIDEMQALHHNNTWVLVPRHLGMNVTGCH